MTVSILIDQQDKFGGKHNSKINLYDIFSNEHEIPNNVSKRQLLLGSELHQWWYIGTLRKEELSKLQFLDLSVCENWEMIPVENKDQVDQIKQLL